MCGGSYVRLYRPRASISAHPSASIIVVPMCYACSALGLHTVHYCFSDSVLIVHARIALSESSEAPLRTHSCPRSYEVYASFSCINVRLSRDLRSVSKNTELSAVLQSIYASCSCGNVCVLQRAQEPLYAAPRLGDATTYMPAAHASMYVCCRELSSISSVLCVNISDSYDATVYMRRASDSMYAYTRSASESMYAKCQCINVCINTPLSTMLHKLYARRPCIPQCVSVLSLLVSSIPSVQTIRLCVCVMPIA